MRPKRRWAADSSQGQRSRLFEPGDWVRTEIEAAFAQGKHVIPVLVGGAAMPAPEALPPAIQRLARLQATPLSDRHWEADLALLLRQLRALMPALPQTQPAAATGMDTPAQALRDIAERVFEALATQRPPQRPAAPAGAASRLLRSLGRWFGRRLRALLRLTLLLAAVYVGLRLFGDAPTLAWLDALEARLQLGWGRLLRWVAGR